MTGRVRSDMQTWNLGEAVNGPPTWVPPTISAWSQEMVTADLHPRYTPHAAFVQSPRMYQEAANIQFEWNFPCTASCLASPLKSSSQEKAISAGEYRGTVGMLSAPSSHVAEAPQFPFTHKVLRCHNRLSLDCTTSRKDPVP